MEWALPSAATAVSFAIILTISIPGRESPAKRRNLAKTHLQSSGDTTGVRPRSGSARAASLADSGGALPTSSRRPVLALALSRLSGMELISPLEPWPRIQSWQMAIGWALRSKSALCITPRTCKWSCWGTFRAKSAGSYRRARARRVKRNPSDRNICADPDLPLPRGRSGAGQRPNRPGRAPPPPPCPPRGFNSPFGSPAVPSIGTMKKHG